MKAILKVGVYLTGLLPFNTALFSQSKIIQPITTNQPIALSKEIKMENQNSALKEYILLVRLPVNYGPEKAKEVREQWNTLLEKWKADGTYIAGFVYPNDGYIVTGSDKSVTNEGVVSNNFKLVSNMILKAKNYEAALLLAKECPVLAQGGMIEVKEIQPRPNTTQQNASKINLYAIRFSPGEKYDLDKSVNEQDLIEHGLYMKGLKDSGKLLIAGPFSNDTAAMVILNVADEAEALNIAGNDPAVLKKIFNYKINTWDIRFATIKF